MQQMHNMFVNSSVHLGRPQVAPPAPIQFTDQQLTTISQAINATTTIPATSSVMDVGSHGGTSSAALQQMDTSNAQQQSVTQMNPNCSASDIILNSHSVILGAPSLGGAPGDGLVVVTSASVQNDASNAAIVGALEHGSISPEIILNPAVTPSLLCDAVPVVVPTTSSAVVEANASLLVDPLLTPVVVDPMLGSSPRSSSNSNASSAALQSPQSPNGVSTTAEVVQNVQNMILNAAAEILVSQQTTISNESMQAIISLNNAASMLEQEAVPVVNPIYNSPPAVEEPNNLVMMVQQSSNILAETQQQQQQQQVTSQVAQSAMCGVPGDIHMRTVHEEIGHLTG